jgi:hypothetical protein
MRGEGDCGVSANEYSCAHGAQINVGDLTPYLTYVCTCIIIALLNIKKGRLLPLFLLRVYRPLSTV